MATAINFFLPLPLPPWVHSMPQDAGRSGHWGWECWTVPLGDKAEPEHHVIFHIHAKCIVFMALFKILMNWGGPVCPKLTWCTRKGCELLLADFCSKASSVTLLSALLQCGGENTFYWIGAKICNPHLSRNPVEVSTASFPQFHHQQSPLGFCHPKQVCQSKAVSWFQLLQTSHTCPFTTYFTFQK